MRQVCDAFVPNHKRYVRSIELRPEVLFQIIFKHEEKKLLSFIKKILQTRQFNKNHLFISYLISKGNSVITTNFDTLIEIACEKNGVSFRKSLGNKKLHPGFGGLFKIHGSIDDYESLQLTINQVGKGLGLNKQNIFTETLAGNTVLVLGYSGLDQLDIMPVLKNASYKKLIWINHSSRLSYLRRSIPYNKYVRELTKNDFFSLNTNLLIDELEKREVLGSSSSKSKSKPPAIRDDSQINIVADILMHQNQYKKVISLRKKVGVGSLYLEVARYRAYRSLDITFDKNGAKRALLLGEIYRLNSRSRRIYYPFIAQHINSYIQLVDLYKELQSINIRDLSESDVEAILEVAFSLCRYHAFIKVEKLLKKTLSFSRRNGDLLMEARTHIIFCALHYFLYYFHEKKSDVYRKDILKHAIKHADRAIFLLNSDILADEFYLAQAKNNKALILVIQKKYDKAIILYKEVAGFYRSEKNVGHYVSSLNNISSLYLRQRNFAKALSVINLAIKANLDTKRGYGSGEIYRLKARILLEMPKSVSRVKNIEKLLLISISDFDDNEKEIQETKIDFVKLKRIKKIFGLS